MSRSEFSPDLQRIADLVDRQPARVREIFHYLLVLMMVDDEKAKVVAMGTYAGRTFLSTPNKTVA